MKRKALLLLWIIPFLLLMIAGCAQGTTGNSSVEETNREDWIVVGFSQLGAESYWRSANTNSMLSTFTEAAGYKLIFEDGQQKQANQIAAIRRFIQQEVDYIVLAPVTETGWDSVLLEAKEAGIPVIIIDRMVAVEDDSLFTCWVGSDFELEGKKICEWLRQYSIDRQIDPSMLRIVNIQGTIGASAQIGRTKALREASKEYGWELLLEDRGDFTQLKAKETMEKILRNRMKVNVVYCENDNEAFGAIEALEAAGLTVGGDLERGEVMVLSFDGVDEEAVRYVRDGKIACLAECNPIHGLHVETIIQTLEKGGVPEKYQYIEETIFSGYPDVLKLEIEGREYPVQILNGVTGENSVK